MKKQKVFDAVPPPRQPKQEAAYKLPAGMILAISANRPELIEFTIEAVRAGVIKADPELTIELLRLTADYMEDIQKLREQVRQFREQRDEANKQIEDALKALAPQGSY